MKQSLVTREIWQHSPTKSLIESESVKEWTKLSSQKNSNKTRSKKSALYLKGTDYPDLRFSCPNCGILDVLIEWKNFETLKGHCLDCKHEWLGGESM